MQRDWLIVFSSELRSLPPRSYERYVRARKEVYSIFILPRSAYESQKAYDDSLEHAESILNDLYNGVNEAERINELRAHHKKSEAAIALERTRRAAAARRAQAMAKDPTASLRQRAAAFTAGAGGGTIILPIPTIRMPRDVLDAYAKAENEYLDNRVGLMLDCGLREHVTAPLRQRYELLAALGALPA